jgi:hypothetical protein
MENSFKKLLFKTAICCMACDGHIDPREEEEVKKMGKNITYFSDLDLSAELAFLLNDLLNRGKKVINDYFIELKEAKLNTIQELLILEVALRIIHADDKIDENEVKFLRLLRGQLNVYNEIIADRFGRDNLLFDKAYSENAENPINEFVDNIDLPKFNEFADLKASLGTNIKN